MSKNRRPFPLNHLRRSLDWLVLAALALVLGACVGSPTADPTASPPAGAAARVAARPAGVPDDFVHTPNGYFHPSCVIQLGEHERVRADGSIMRADGSLHTLPGCAYPHFDRQGRVKTGDAGDPKRAARQAEHLPFAHDWVMSAQDNSNGNLQFIEADWHVPDVPLDPNGQTLFYFPGLQDSTAILQPVLQYNQGGWPGWSASSWFCCVNGYTWQSGTIPVNVSDHIYGNVIGSSCEQGFCTEWQVLTEDVTTGHSEILTVGFYPSGMQDAVGGALEAYNIDSCLQFSATHMETFYNVRVWKVDGNEASTNWFQQKTGLSPQCGYSETLSSETVRLIVGNNGEP